MYITHRGAKSGAYRFLPNGVATIIANGVVHSAVTVPMPGAMVPVPGAMVPVVGATVPVLVLGAAAIVVVWSQMFCDALHRMFAQKIISEECQSATIQEVIRLQRKEI